MTEREKLQHIDNFRNALLSVSPVYFGAHGLDERIQIIERAFAYELYHQLRLIYNGRNGRNWYVSGELRKGLTFFPEYGQDNTLIPDLVIHQHETTTQNIIAVEIKTNPDVTGPELIKDLEKLALYTKPTRQGRKYLDYHIGILLVVKSNFRQKLNNMRTQNRQRIIELLDFHRIAIWNIETPSPINNHGELDPNCLTIIRRNNIEK